MHHIYPSKQKKVPQHTQQETLHLAMIVWWLKNKLEKFLILYIGNGGKRILKKHQILLLQGP